MYNSLVKLHIERMGNIMVELGVLLLIRDKITSSIRQEMFLRNDVVINRLCGTCLYILALG